MRVATLLAKELEGKLFHKHGGRLLSANEMPPIDIEKWHGRLLERRGENFDGTLKHAFALQGEKNYQGLDIAIENRVGSVRKGKNADGTEWETRFKTPYGYLRGTKGADDEPIDCYVGRSPDSDTAYVVHQKNEDGKHDEDTVMLGYDSAQAAKKDILRHYDDPKYVGSVTSIALDKLKELVSDGKKIEKIGVATHDQTFLDTDIPGTTGLPAQPRRRRGDVPSREDVDPYPTPKVERGGDVASTATVGTLGSPGGFEDVGKSAETLGERSRSYEVPSDDEPSPHGGNRQGSGGLVEAPSPSRTAEEKEMRGPFSLSLSEIGSAMSQDGDSTKGAAATNRFPKADSVEDNTFDVQKMGDRVTELDEPAKVAFGFGPDGEFYVNGELVPVRHTQSEKLAHIMLESFFEHLQKLSEARGFDHRVGDALQFRKMASDLFYVASSEPLSKEALGFGQIGQGVRAAAGKLMPMAAAGAGPEVQAFRKGTGFFSTGMGRDLHQGGKMLAHNAPAAAQKAGLAAKDVGAVGAMRPTNMGRRIAGETAIGAGHHMEHAGPGLMAMNPVGVPMGGAIEGFTRGVGKEMQRAGNATVQNAGHTLVRHAPKIGFGGEILAGTALGAPGLAPMMGHQLGAMAGHLGSAAHGIAHSGVAQHMMGAGAQEATMGASRMLPRMGSAAMEGMMGLKARAGRVGGKLVGA